MCGIAGKVTTGTPVDRFLVSGMCDSIRHRGPDGEGIFVDGQAGLGMRRLAVIDLVSGAQPYFSEDETVVAVFNGEIYNHLALREELAGRGHSFRGHSDGEVIVHLYEELGEGCVERLEGMFAFAIWDRRSRRLLLGRDRMGKKPLYVARQQDTISFASEVRALFLDPAVRREVDSTAIDAFLVNQYVPHDLCAFKGVAKLAPGTVLIWEEGGRPRLRRYWSPRFDPMPGIDPAEATAELRATILAATRDRLMSDVPLGAFLSGGVDSSIVVAAMAQTASEPVRTFAAAFPGADVDESKHARQVAELFGTRHTEIEIAAPDPDLLRRIAWYFGEPFADPATLPTFQLAEVTRQFVTVALSGDGGDESFAGYRRYWQLAQTRAADSVPAGIRRRVASLAERVGGGTDGRSAGPRLARLAGRLAMEPPYRYADLFRYFRDEDRRRLYTPDFLSSVEGDDPLAHVAASWDGHPGLATVDRLMAVDMDTYLPDDLLAKVDITSMANSLEVRSPLLDRRVVEFGGRLPLELKLKGRDGKRILRDAAREWLPAEILDRPKQGFAVPVADWLRTGPMRSLPEEVLLDPRSIARGIFRPEEVRRLIDEHRSGRDRAGQIWAMINLELWFEVCVDRPPTAAI
jgi:asparagine synthase (glutamine-hydrolysing)